MPLSPADQGLLDAARYGTGKLLALWIKRGANPAASVPADATSLANGTAGFGVWHWLVDRGHAAVLLDLLNQPGVPYPLDAQDAHGNTAAHLAAVQRPTLFRPLLTAAVRAVRNHAGETPLDVLERQHPDTFASLDLPLPSQEAPPSAAVAFPTEWAAPPQPDPTLPGEAGITPQAWQQRLWDPEPVNTDPPSEPGSPPSHPASPLPFVAPVIEWSTFALDAQGDPAPVPATLPGSDAPTPENVPLAGEMVMPPVAVDETDAWVVDLEALLRPTSLIPGLRPPARVPPASTAVRAPAVPPVIVPASPDVPFPALRLLDNRPDQEALHPLDEHPEDAVGHAFIADPAAWAATMVERQTQGQNAPVSLADFALPTTLLPATTSETAWALRADPMDPLVDDPSAPHHVQQGTPTVPPSWNLVAMNAGPQGLAAEVAAEMARLAGEPVTVPAWGLLPMNDAPRVALSDEDGWADAPVTLAPKEPPAWKLVDA